MLGLAVTDALYRDHPDLAEGQLAKLRASVVNTRALAGVARELGLGRWLRLGRGEEVTGGRDKNSILADTTEAVIGAVYLDRGVAAAVALVHRLFGPLMRAAASEGAALDWKTALQELTAARSLGVPDYRISESGPDHAKSFVAVVHVAGTVHGEGAGRSKKEAEQQAAQAAFGGLSADRGSAVLDLPALDGEVPGGAATDSAPGAADDSAARTVVAVDDGEAAAGA